MIININEYNPLPEIKKVASNWPLYTMSDIDVVKKELFKAGVVPETDEELNTVICLLEEMEII